MSDGWIDIKDAENGAYIFIDDSGTHAVRINGNRVSGFVIICNTGNYFGSEWYGSIDNSKGKVISADVSELCPAIGAESYKVDELRRAVAEYKGIIKELEAELPFKLVNNKSELVNHE